MAKWVATAKKSLMDLQRSASVESGKQMIHPQPGPMTLAEYDRLRPPDGECYELYDGYVVAFSTGTGARDLYRGIEPRKNRSRV